MKVYDIKWTFERKADNSSTDNLEKQKISFVQLKPMREKNKTEDNNKIKAKIKGKINNK